MSKRGKKVAVCAWWLAVIAAASAAQWGPAHIRELFVFWGTAGIVGYAVVRALEAWAE